VVIGGGLSSAGFASSLGAAFGFSTLALGVGLGAGGGCTTWGIPGIMPPPYIGSVGGGGGTNPLPDFGLGAAGGS